MIRFYFTQKVVAFPYAHSCHLKPSRENAFLTLAQVIWKNNLPKLVHTYARLWACWG